MRFNNVLKIFRILTQFSITILIIYFFSDNSSFTSCNKIKLNSKTNSKLKLKLNSTPVLNYNTVILLSFDTPEK